jgi:hypothetical protein
MTHLNLVTDALATYRLTRLIQRDTVTQPLRDLVFAHFPDPSDPATNQAKNPAYLLVCPHCLSIYAATLITLGRIVAPRTTAAASRILALSAVTSIIAEREEARDQDGF